MSPFSPSMCACAPWWVGMCAPPASCLHLYIHALYADSFRDCFKHGNAAVRLIAIVPICSIFEIYIYFAVKCANMILTVCSSLMLLAKR